MRHAKATTFLRDSYVPGVIGGLISECDLTVGMRLHSVIFAAMADVPFVGLTYDPKVTNLLRRLNFMKYAVPLSAGMGEKLLDTMLLVWKERQKIMKGLSVKTVGFKKLAGENARLAVALLENGFADLSKRSIDTSFIREFTLKQTRLLAEQEQATQAISGQLLEQVKAIQELKERLAERDREVQVLNERWVEENRGVKFLQARLSQESQTVRTLSAQVADITRSHAWAVIWFLWRVRLWLAPHGSRRERLLRFVLRGDIVKRLMDSFRRIVNRFQKWIQEPPPPFAEAYAEVDYSQVTLYTDNLSLFPGYSPRRALSEKVTEWRCQVSLIASVKNEAPNVEEWLQSIFGQTRLPDEIVVVDGGSTDGTEEMLQLLAEHCHIPFRVLIEPGANIARDRNIAITNARFPIIAITDFGCQPNPDWLEKLIAPFELDSKVQVSAGFYDPIDRKGQSLRQSGIWLRYEQISPQFYLPASNSVAVAKSALDAVNGYPEWLTETGEDTYLDLELKRLGGKWAFVPDAVVRWVAPDTLVAYLRKMYQWAIGDGESGVHARYYWRYVLRLTTWTTASLLLLALAATVLTLPLQLPWLWIGLIVSVWLIGLWLTAQRSKLSIPVLLQKTLGEAAQVAGFLKGARRREEIDRRRFSLIKGTFFILSGVPIDDTGGGARGTQLALELLRQGYAVVFINRFPKDESKELGLRYAHPNLFIYSLPDFAWEKFREEHCQLFDGKMLSAIIEFPLPEYLFLIENIQECGGVVIYDLLDAWDTSLGGQWFSLNIEREIIRSSQVLAATVPALAERLEQISGRSVTLLPNAVDTRLFDPELSYARPTDLPAAEWTIIYIGALWGEWFDWDLLQAVAIRYPDASVVVIGDYHGQCSQPPSNLHFLGLKPQRELPAYLACADVAIIPWKVSTITQATSPIKVFEYLAMRCPVVAPVLDPLQDIPGVLLAQDAEGFVSLVDQARRSPMSDEAVTTFLDENNWHSRVAQFVACVQKVITGFS